MKRFSVGLLLITGFLAAHAQSATRLQPGFDATEYLELLQTYAFQGDSVSIAKEIPEPKRYRRVYRSPVVGLLNRWDLWLRDDNVAVISIRGTVNKFPSWLANFYAAMLPATGSLQLNDSTTFTYQLASRPDAMVHVGWTVSLGHLAPTILEQIKKLYTERQVKEFIVMGHSQGGAIAFLLRSHLHYLMQRGELPTDLVLKTYCSAAPKPGNLYYAYDFDFITRNGWAFTVVNASDWVPEVPFSVQTLSDFNAVNPFVNIKGILKKQSLLVRLYGKRVYNRLSRSTRRAQRNFTKYLGRDMYRLAKRNLPQYRQPAYAEGTNYMRAGSPVVLMPDDEYRTQFPDDPAKIFVHHMLWPYYTLAKRWYADRER